MSDKLKKKVKVHKVGTSFDCTKQFINAIRHCSDFINYSCAISDDEINIKIKFKPNRQKGCLIMKCKLVGKKRGVFQDNNGREVRFGQIFVTYPLEESLEEDSLTVGDEAAKLSLDYDSIGDLQDKLPVDVELNINLRGKVLSVELL